MGATYFAIGALALALFCIQPANGQRTEACSVLCGGGGDYGYPSLEGRQYLGPQVIYPSLFNRPGKVSSTKKNKPSKPLPKHCTTGLFCYQGKADDGNKIRHSKSRGKRKGKGKGKSKGKKKPK